MNKRLTTDGRGGYCLSLKKRWRFLNDGRYRLGGLAASYGGDRLITDGNRKAQRWGVYFFFRGVVACALPTFTTYWDLKTRGYCKCMHNFYTFLLLSLYLSI